MNASTADVPVPPPSDASSEIRIANTSATTHMPIANAPPRSQSTIDASGIETSPPNSVAISIARYGLSECCTERKTTAYAPIPMNACCPTETSPP